jgi:hypothetical protein
MIIGCLGWGSLIWKPEGLPVRRYWFADGPFLPIEFARQSKDDRITLVIVAGKSFPLVRSLWAVMSLTDLNLARESLRQREGISKDNIDSHIGIWRNDQANAENEIHNRVGSWAKQVGIDAVIWTNLPPKFQGHDGQIPTREEVVSHLSQLEGAKRDNAEQYIRMTPRQIDTDYRQYIESKLNWSPY